MVYESAGSDVAPGAARAHEARYWHRMDDGRVQCDLCPRKCHLRPGQRGFCFVRENRGGELVCTTYGRSSGFCVDPIEKKPLNHVTPGAAVLSFGTAGCNLACQFCQNWEISTARDVDLLQQQASPYDIAEAAVQTGSRGVAYTYNDPIIFAEYAIDTAQACHERGLLNIAVTAGYICEEPRRDFFSVMDAANVDLKSFNPDFYRKIVGGRLEVILDTLKYIVSETTCWLEITTLLIPGHNDSDTEIHALVDWVAGELGTGVPLHFTGFHPDNRMMDVPRTRLSTLEHARRIALDAGLKFVYTGNVPDREGSTTFCPGCGRGLIVRDGYDVTRYDLTLDSAGESGQSAGRESGSFASETPDSRPVPTAYCAHCGTPIPGRWDPSVGSFGNRRIPILL